MFLRYFHTHIKAIIEVYGFLVITPLLSKINVFDKCFFSGIIENV